MLIIFYWIIYSLLIAKEFGNGWTVYKSKGHKYNNSTMITCLVNSHQTKKISNAKNAILMSRVMDILTTVQNVSGAGMLI